MKRLVLVLSIFVLMGAGCSQTKGDTQKPLDNPEDDVVNMEVIDKLTPPASDWLTTTILSWNTAEYGRVYASVCSSPRNVFPCNWCTDAGTTFYDRDGELMTNCFGMPDRITPSDDSVLCGYFGGLDYHDADYISQEAIDRCSEVDFK